MFYTPIQVEILGSSYELQLNRYNLPQAMNYPPGINVLAQVRPLCYFLCDVHIQCVLRKQF